MANRKDPEKGIAAQVKAHKNADGMVTVYPTNPIGAHYVKEPSGFRWPSTKQDVTPEQAEMLLGYYPAAFTLYESGNPLPEQEAIHAEKFEQAWGATSTAPVEATVEVQTDTPDGESKEA